MKHYTTLELSLFYGSAYLIVALINTFLFAAIIGSWTGRDILLSFSMWGLIWLVSMFAYPMFFMDVYPERIALNGYYALFGYVVIIGVFVATYFLHKYILEKREGKKLKIAKILDLYFPRKKSNE